MKWFDDVKKFYVFSALTKRLALPVIALYMIDSGVTLQEIAFIVIATSILGLIMEIPSGAVADTMGHKRALIISMIGQGASMALYLGGDFYWILAGSLLYWGSGTLLTGTNHAIFYERLQVLGRVREYKKLLGRSRSVAHGVGIVFMAVAGVLYMVHYSIPFIAGVVQFGLAAVIISMFGKTRKGRVGKFEIAMVGDHIKEAIELMKKNKDIFWIVISFASVLASTYVFYEYDQIRMEELGLLASGVGFVYAGKRIIGAVAPLTLDKIERFASDRRAIKLGVLLVAIFFVMSSFAGSFEVIIIGILIMTFVSIALEVIVDNHINQRVDTDARATLLSFTSFTVGLVKSLGMLFVGVLVGVLPLFAALGVLSVVILIACLVIFLPGLRHVR